MSLGHGLKRIAKEQEHMQYITINDPVRCHLPWLQAEEI